MGFWSRLLGAGAPPGRDGSPLDERVRVPAHVLAVHWGFEAPVAALEWDLTIHADPGSVNGLYLALWNGTVDGSMCYFGLQTDVHRPSAGGGTGKGLIYSTWWTFDLADARLGGADAYAEQGTHEGRFVGVRRPYRWTTGSYRVRWARAEADRRDGVQADWFDLSIVPTDAPAADGSRPAATGAPVVIGGFRFPRQDPGVPATIDPGGLTFCELYAGVTRWADVRPWRVDVMAYGDGRRCERGTTEYATFPFGQAMPNANIAVVDHGRTIALAIGADVTKVDRAGGWG